MKKFIPPLENFEKILGNPKYFGISNKDEDQLNLASPSTSVDLKKSPNSVFTPLSANLSVEEEDELLLNISDDIVGMSPEKKKQNDQNRELLKYLQRDLTNYENEKLDLLKKNKSLLNHFEMLQKKKVETAKCIALNKNELMALDLELENIQKIISEIEAKKELLL